MAVNVCPTHGPYDNKPISIFGTSLSFGCPGCAEEKRRSVEDALIAKGAKSVWESMNIPPTFYDVSFETTVVYSADFERNVDMVKRLVSKDILSLVMTGTHGTGKTHLAICALKQLGGIYYTMYDLTVRIRSSYTPQASETEYDIMQELSHVPLLVIDEIGRVKQSDASLNWLSAIIDKRYMYKRKTILISNRHMTADCPDHGCQYCLEQYIPHDAMSRISSNGAFLRFTGSDRRIQATL